MSSLWSSILDGRTDPPPAIARLRAGPLLVEFESGDVRYVRLGDREVVRRIYVAVRDQNWVTVPARLSDVEIEDSGGCFRISYMAEHVEGPVDFLWRAAIEGTADGSLRFEMDGQARSSFHRNRIGFCVLHPIRECAGARCLLTHADGSTRETTFPRIVAPQNPFLELSGLAHEVEAGLWANLRFEGDIFETEDQRNWIDGSYKTFCTPLRLPFPVLVRAGERVRQVVSIRLEGTRKTSVDSSGPTRIRIGSEPVAKVPDTGLCQPSSVATLGNRQRELLQILSPAHLLVELDLWKQDWQERLLRAVEDAEAIGCRLDLSIATGEESSAVAELARLAEIVETQCVRVGSWQVFTRGAWSTPAEAVERARGILSTETAGIRLVAGTRANYLEINRTPPPIERLDAICFSAHPQVHAFDNRSLVENLEGLASALESARVLGGGLPLEVGPITLRMRMNPYATGPEPEPPPDTLPARVDVRQMSLFGAAWTLGALKRLAEGRVERASLYETVGWLGVMEDDRGARLSGRFPSRPGQVFPLFHVLADFNEFRGGDVLPGSSTRPLAMDGFALRRGHTRRVLAANYTPELADVEIEGLGRRVRVRRLDASNAWQDAESARRFRVESGLGQTTDDGALALRMTPYSVVCIDTE